MISVEVHTPYALLFLNVRSCCDIRVVFEYSLYFLLTEVPA
jgi:hypothetical protein